jgi:hypothetical protein
MNNHMSGDQVATTHSERNSPCALSRFFAIGPFPHSAVGIATLSVCARIRSPRSALETECVQYMQTFTPACRVPTYLLTEQYKCSGCGSHCPDPR